MSNHEPDVIALKALMQKYETKWHAPCEASIGGEEWRDGTGTIELTATKKVEKFVQSYGEWLTGHREHTPARVSEDYRPKSQMGAADEAERASVAGKPYGK